MMPSEEIVGALARGYCTEENKNKIVDPTLIKAMADELNKAGYHSHGDIDCTQCDKFNALISEKDVRITFLEDALKRAEGKCGELLKDVVLNQHYNKCKNCKFWSIEPTRREDALMGKCGRMVEKYPSMGYFKDGTKVYHYGVGGYKSFVFTGDMFGCCLFEDNSLLTTRKDKER